MPRKLNFKGFVNWIAKAYVCMYVNVLLTGVLHQQYAGLQQHLILSKWSNPKTFRTLAYQPSKGRNSEPDLLEVLAFTIATATETCGDYCSIRMRSRHAMTRSQTLARSHSPDEYWKSYYRIRIECGTIAIVNTIATIAQA